MTEDLKQAAEGLHKVCKKIHRWLVKSAEVSEQNAKGWRARTPAFADDCVRDAKNFRATAKDVGAAIAAYKEAKRKMSDDACQRPPRRRGVGLKKQ